MPVFLTLTSFMNGEPIIVNVSKVQTMTSLKEQDGTALAFDGGRRLFVKETTDQIIQQTNAVRFLSVTI